MYFVTLLGAWLIFGIIPAGLAIWLGATGLQALIIYGICGSLAIFPIDKKIDETWRGTVPIVTKGQDNA